MATPQHAPASTALLRTAVAGVPPAPDSPRLESERSLQHNEPFKICCRNSHSQRNVFILKYLLVPFEPPSPSALSKGSLGRTGSPWWGPRCRLDGVRQDQRSQVCSALSTLPPAGEGGGRQLLRCGVPHSVPRSTSWEKQQQAQGGRCGGVVVRQGSTTTPRRGAWARPTPAHCSGQGAQGSEGS